MMVGTIEARHCSNAKTKGGTKMVKLFGDDKSDPTKDKDKDKDKDRKKEQRPIPKPEVGSRYSPEPKPYKPTSEPYPKPEKHGFIKEDDKAIKDMQQTSKMRSGTVIGKGVIIKGEIAGSEDIEVLGRIEGSISFKNNLTVGEGGTVKADISANEVIISGNVVGNVTASTRFELTATGRMEGDIRSPKVAIANGALFHGKIDMRKPGEPLPPDLQAKEDSKGVSAQEPSQSSKPQADKPGDLKKPTETEKPKN